MTAPAVIDHELLATAVRNPGRLVLGASSTTGAFPFGGVPIGVKRDVDLVWLAEYQDVRDPLSGALLKRIRRSIEIPYLRFLLELPWDQNVLDAQFNATIPAASLPFQAPPETGIVGSVVPVAIVNALGGATPVSLALIADDPRLPSVHFAMAIPRLESDVTPFMIEKKATFVIDFEPIPTVDTTDFYYPYVGVKPWFQVKTWGQMVL